MERVVLRVNAYNYLCKQSEQKGGCAAYRNRQREEEQLEALRRKWGGGNCQGGYNEQRQIPEREEAGLQPDHQGADIRSVSV